MSIKQTRSLYNQNSPSKSLVNLIPLASTTTIHSYRFTQVCSTTRTCTNRIRLLELLLDVHSSHFFHETCCNDIETVSSRAIHFSNTCIRGDERSAKGDLVAVCWRSAVRNTSNRPTREYRCIQYLSTLKDSAKLPPLSTPFLFFEINSST